MPASAEDTAELNRQNDARIQEIEDTIKQQQPLTSERVPISELDKQYATTNDGSTSNNFLAGLAALKKDYGHIRMVRGDGNCYYRAFLYSLVEQLLLQQESSENKKKEGERILAWLKTDSWKAVLANGYDEMTMEIFYDTIVELLERVVVVQGGPPPLTPTTFHAEMNQENATSDYCTWYLRVVTAVHLKSDPNRFLPFIEQPGLDVQQFCQREVEPMGKECEMLQALALAEAFGVQVQIEYLDGHDLVNGKLSRHTVGATGEDKLHLTLLYRPGHYDILYPL